MTCCICLFLPGKSYNAITIIDGYAVCEDHIGYVQGGNWFSILRLARDNEELNASSR